MRKIPLAVPNLEGDEADLLQRCITTTFVSSVGEFVDEFEGDIARKSGVKHAAVVSSGTVALKMAFKALGIGEGDFVLMPSLTFIATSNAIKHSGAEPWLIDVTPDTWTIDLHACRQQLEAETEATPGGRVHKNTGGVVKAICPVMVMGAMLDFDAICAFAREFGLKVVVDAAAAIGGLYQDTVGIAATGVDAVCYSFNGNKTVTCGGGGAIASQDAELIARIKHLTTTGRVGANYDHDVVAYNYRMTNVQAAIGVAQIRRLDQFLAAKRNIRNEYAALAEDYPQLSAFPEPAFGLNTHWFSGFYYTGDANGICDDFRVHMNEAGIDLRKFWKPIHMQTPYLDAVQSDMPICDALWERIFPLPCSTGLTDAELSKTLSAARSFWDNVG